MNIPHRHTLRALARLLSYPDDALLAQAPAIADLLADGTGLSAPAQAGLVTLVRELLTVDPLALQAAYVETFDRGRRTSLHLFEHVHGDSRDRGPAMIDLGQMYAKSGLLLADGELPDYLPAVLEFASTQDAATARSFLGEMAHILHAVHDALAERGSAYAGVLAAVLDVAGEHAHAVARRSAPEADEPLDASWAEPEAFNGCSSAGQAAPNQAQPVHVVRRSPASQRSGAAA
ncbi:nitrate reductase molybdenum cofactor assembly chaperone [Aquabacterium humicola]|uniref:nitrate reductase molybdenum cofactor assembly chaperone n=1 Tax=Aquabacterium humicola TaxID=3237377 RepID=UPI002543F986|nr:nitrate reductase molybdenum cofactor assembly chaperone [Rubrivivax pictus]